jgi:hypothetical protein
LVAKLAKEFPDILSLSKVGHTKQGKPLIMITLDVDGEKKLLNKPAMFLSGAHHAREFVSTQMPLYSLLRLLHGGVVHDHEKYKNLIT